MRKTKKSSFETIFEQVPIALVRTIAERETDVSLAEIASCAICGNPVELERCKTNEYGKAVHEICYVTTIQKLQPTWASAQ